MKTNSLVKKIGLIFFTTLLIITVSAQTTTTKPKKSKKAKTETNTTGKKKKKGKSGVNDGRDWRSVYVVQVMSSPDRELVYQQKAKLYQMYPDNRVYVKSELPFYRLRLGFFSTKDKAEKYKKQIGDKFGEPALVLKDNVVLNTKKIQKKRNPTPTTPPKTEEKTNAKN
jgi:hypothetical protein